MSSRFAAAVQKNENKQLLKDMLEEYGCHPDEFNINELLKDVVRVSQKIPLKDVEIADKPEERCGKCGAGLEGRGQFFSQDHVCFPKE